MIEYLEQTFHMVFPLIILFGMIWMIVLLGAIQLYILIHMFIAHLYKKLRLKEWLPMDFGMIGINFEDFVMSYPPRDKNGYTPMTWKRIHWQGKWTPFCVLSHNTNPLSKKWRHPKHNVN